MNKLSQFQLIEDPLVNQYSYPFKLRTTTSIAIIKKYINKISIVFTIILLIIVFIMQRQISSLNKTATILSEDNAVSKHDISQIQLSPNVDSSGFKRELQDMKEVIASLTKQLDVITMELKKNGQLIDNAYDNLTTSSIITTPNQLDFIHHQFTKSQKSYRLLYKATKSGDTFDALYRSIKGIPSTLVIIKSGNGAIFGGYSKKEWSQFDDHILLNETSIDDSFLFNVNKKKNYSRIQSKVFTYKGLLSFGNDLTLVNSFLSSDENTSVFPTNFNYVMNFAEPFALTEGEETFRVVEVEIYKVGTIADL